jgi:hypothetical protein
LPTQRPTATAIRHWEKGAIISSSNVDAIQRSVLMINERLKTLTEELAIQACSIPPRP